uniref:Uncharacterized protein n=1 Tax=Anguilla anguilla TaxID=7936 RepID=A0A0E9VY27_ANGAN
MIPFSFRMSSVLQGMNIHIKVMKIACFNLLKFYSFGFDFQNAYLALSFTSLWCC